MIHLCENEDLQRQIEEFNMQFACNCCIKYNENILMPQVVKESGTIYFSKRFSLIILLFIIRPFYKTKLDKLMFLYFAVDLNIKNGYVENARFLLNELLTEFEETKEFEPCCEFPNIYLNETIGALLVHEMSHYKYFLYPEVKETEVNELKNEILDVCIPMGIRGMFLKFALRKLKNDPLRLEELACDSTGVRFFAKQISSSCNRINKQEISNAVEQLTRVFVNLQQVKNLEDLSTYTIKQHIIDHVFDVYRVGNINMTLINHMKEYTCQMIESMKSEIFDYNHTLLGMCKICWDKLDYSYTLGAKNIYELNEDENAEDAFHTIKKVFCRLSTNMFDYFKSVIV